MLVFLLFPLSFFRLSADLVTAGNMGDKIYFFEKKTLIRTPGKVLGRLSQPPLSVGDWTVLVEREGKKILNL